MYIRFYVDRSEQKRAVLETVNFDKKEQKSNAMVIDCFILKIPIDLTLGYLGN